MNTLHVLYHLALADFYERARRYRFLLTLAAVIYLGVLVNSGMLFFGLVPGDMTLTAFQGEFNSAWAGTMTVLATNTFLGLFGFYLVNDCIERDIRTGVGQIIATTPVSRAVYLVGKWISNFMVLSVLELILAVAAAAMVLLKQGFALDLAALLIPFLAVALPCMALIAALAVMFQTVPWLRGALGNVAYFFLWISLITSIMLLGGIDLPFLKDPFGLNVFRASLYAGAGAAFPNETIRMMTIQIDPSHNIQFRTFNWLGLAWTLGIVARQWFWAVFGLGLVLLSTVWFARFDPSREGLRRPRVKPEEAQESELTGQRDKSPHIALPSLSPFVSNLAQLNPFLGVLFAELRMLLNGRRWWWWLIIAGLNIAILRCPLSITKQYLLPFAWLVPLALWSEMGNREHINSTFQMVFSSSRPVLRQLPAAWLAGVLATALFAIAGALVFLINGELAALAGWAGAAVFIPTLALALGVFSSGSRVFEVVYVIWWYFGPFQKSPGLDFTSGPPLIYLISAAGLLLLSAYWRSRQVRV